MTESDAVHFEVLAGRYRDEAEVCRQLAERTPIDKEAWLLLAVSWIKLAQLAEGMRLPN